MDALLEIGAGHRMMGTGRHRDTHRIDVSDQGQWIIPSRATRLRSDTRRSLGISIANTNQLDLLEAGIDEGMEASEVTDSDDPNLEWRRVAHAVSTV